MTQPAAKRIFGWLRWMITSSWGPVLLLIAIAVIPRLVLTFSSFAITPPDSWAYSKWGFNIAVKGDIYSHPIYRTPGYPVFLALFYYLFGLNPPVGEVIVFAQRLLGVATGVLIYLIGLRLTTNRWIPFLGALIYLTMPRVLYYETTIHTEPVFNFFLCATIFYAVRLLEPSGEKAPHSAKFAWLALLCAALTLVRPIGQFLIVVFAVLYLIKFRRGAVLQVLVSVLAFFVFLLPWMLVNKKSEGFFGLSRDQGINLYHRVIDIDESQPVPREQTKYKSVWHNYSKAKLRPEVTYFHVYHAFLRGRTSELKTDNLMLGFAIETLKENKMRFVTNTFILFAQFFLETRNSVLFCRAGNSPEFICASTQWKGYIRAFPNYPNRLSVLGRKISTPFMKYAVIPEWILGGLGLYGIILVSRQRRFFLSPNALVIGVIFYFATLTAIFNRAEDRFRLPIDGFLAIYAVLGLFAIYSLITKGRQEKAIPLEG